MHIRAEPAHIVDGVEVVSDSRDGGLYKRSATVGKAPCKACSLTAMMVLSNAMQNTDKQSAIVMRTSFIDLG